MVNKLIKESFQDTNLKVFQMFDESPKVYFVQNALVKELGEAVGTTGGIFNQAMLARNKISAQIASDLDKYIVQEGENIFVQCPCGQRRERPQMSSQLSQGSTPAPAPWVTTRKPAAAPAHKHVHFSDVGEHIRYLRSMKKPVGILALEHTPKVPYVPISLKTMDSIVRKLQKCHRAAWPTEGLMMSNWKITRPPFQEDRKHLVGEASVTTGHPALTTGIAIEMDGNCLFRSLSYHLFGNQEMHGVLHQMICHFIEHKSPRDTLLPVKWPNPQGYKQVVPSEYLQFSNMRADGEWGTDTEILAAAQLFGVDIYMYHYFTNSPQKVWGNHPATTFSKATAEAIYIDNPGLHYEVVLSP